jgi:ABC-type Fe3+-siderophore transport system permease subunit
MLVLALIVLQALGLPEVEDPVPDRIGLSLLMSFAGVGGIIATVLSLITRSRRREWLVGIGTLAGLGIGICFYALSLFVQLVFGP